MNTIKKITRIFLRNLPQYLVYPLIKLGLKRKSRVDFDAINSCKESVGIFKNAIYSYAYINRSKTRNFLDSYNSKKVSPEKIITPMLNKNDPILVCAVRDELVRIKLQIEYHRNIGIKHFAYIDNNSNDGTTEWLKEQPDVSLFYTDEDFHASVKNAWRRQVTDFFGYDRWYLILDADELFIYPGIENINLQKYIDFLEKKKIKAAFSPMIDMYSNNKLFEGNADHGKIMNEYCYFDTDTYKTENELIRKVVTGGPRMRLFGESNTNSKYALIKLSKDMIAGTHENHPYKLNYQTKGAIAFLLHYKFLPNDEVKYRNIAKDGFYGSAFMYEKYIKLYEQNPHARFIYKDTKKLNNSMDLLKISLVDRKFFSKFLNKRIK